MPPNDRSGVVALPLQSARQLFPVAVFRSAIGNPFDGPHDAWRSAMAANSDDLDATLEPLFLRPAMEGNKEAFVALASIHAAAVYATARSLCSSDLEAIELTEDFSERVGPDPCDAGRLSFRVFVSRFLVEDAIERLRRAAPQESTLAQQSLPDLEMLGHRPDIARRLTGALALLEPEDRAAFVLRVAGELSLDDAAAILDLPIWIVRLRTQRA
jgi:DNA-directed RNA polymerase specialized sigma24 family protein